MMLHVSRPKLQVSATMSTPFLGLELYAADWSCGAKFFKSMRTCFFSQLESGVTDTTSRQAVGHSRPKYTCNSMFLLFGKLQKKTSGD
ncbi:hypothetical protein PoB_002058000 [Plakobranchus ocellatus]|uniref:Uncharacterized protein n=1 Tax=Plakobranchus ocellatus TaxID=259542 RepID=A0AAV3ZHL5_9GAST|nr:hypothetical protein PoB_002058000 [Plakobranchus ocellatus]